MPVVLVGTMREEKPTFAMAGWVTRVNEKPPMIAISIDKEAETPKGIIENKSFSINLVSEDMAEITDYCGIVSARDVDKSKLFEVFYGDIKTAPMIEDSAITMECKLTKNIELPTNHFFIGEIVNAYCDESCMTDDKPDIEKLCPMFLTTPDNRYWTVGSNIGEAYSMGKKLDED